jgi:hypothetical protein
LLRWQVCSALLPTCLATANACFGSILSLDALAIDMTPEFRAGISALGRTPPPATDRLEEAL